MSNLRWILLFSGFAILLLLYFTGRPRKTRQASRNQRDAMPQSGHAGLASQDPLMDNNAAQAQPEHHDPYATHAVIDDFDPSEFDSADLSRPGGGYVPQQSAAEAFHGVPAPSAPSAYDTAIADTVPHAEVRATPQSAQQPGSPPELHSVPSPRADMAHEPVQSSAAVASGGGTLGSKLDALGARLTGRRKSVAAAAQRRSNSTQSEPQKVVLLHVVAPEGQVIDGELLLQVFERRRYHFGEKNIFHSLHQGQIVFSIAKMVEPGSFDVDDISSFETPGLVLILPLPGPVAGDVAFEVLVSEAQELADALGCRVLDSKRSTLSRQTTQHLRENISNYVHRQKYFSKAAV